MQISFRYPIIFSKHFQNVRSVDFQSDCIWMWFDSKKCVIFFSMPVNKHFVMRVQYTDESICEYLPYD